MNTLGAVFTGGGGVLGAMYLDSHFDDWSYSFKVGERSFKITPGIMAGVLVTAGALAMKGSGTGKSLAAAAAIGTLGYEAASAVAAQTPSTFGAPAPAAMAGPVAGRALPPGYGAGGAGYAGDRSLFAAMSRWRGR
jgi:hypothetical protein